MKAMIGLLAACIAVALPLSASADMQGQMDKMFGQMSNTTKPGVYSNARRGVATGGSLVIRNQTQPVNLINFQPPSFSGGCGGIDANFGSLSWISGQQIEQLFRNVASNAEGLVFQMAIDQISSELGKQMSFFGSEAWKKISSMKNSCEIAQSIVSGMDSSGSTGMQQYANSQANNSNVENGQTSDYAASADNQAQSTQDAANSDPALYKAIAQNVVWTALTDHNVSSAFQDDNEFNQEMMSLSGTVITCLPDKDPSCAPPAEGGAKGVGMTYVAPTLTLEDLLYGNTGGNPQVLVCDTTDKCMNPHEQDWNNAGFITMVDNMIGTDGKSGYLGVLLLNQPSSSKVQSFISNAGDAGAMIADVARTSPASAVTYAQEIAPMVALELAYHEAVTAMDAVANSLKGQTSPAAAKALEQLNQHRRQLDEDYRRLADMPTMTKHMADLAAVLKSYAGNPTLNTSDTGLQGGGN